MKQNGHKKTSMTSSHIQIDHNSQTKEAGHPSGEIKPGKLAALSKLNLVASFTWMYVLYLSSEEH